MVSALELVCMVSALELVCMVIALTSGYMFSTFGSMCLLLTFESCACLAPLGQCACLVPLSQSTCLATLCKDGTCSAKVHIRIASAMARLNRTWRSTPLALQASLSSTSLLSPPLSSTAVKHVPCLLTLKEKIQAFETKCMRKLLYNSYLKHKTNDWVWSEVNFLVDPQEPLSRGGNLHGSGMSHALQNHSSGHLGGWATLWSAEEMVDGQHQRVNIPASARTAHKGLLLHNRLEEDLC